ncbi:Uncharacterised protein [BD1-7 clade bacterium]|uniref:Prophage CP4-57 regulatory protein AlpA n=1 Tax=BD1-7 clade bacterium TaxID=2029982 RepID=A0A5S9PCG4_9GAMM|nr:Uncharacterised protein [BD1-7 clade bacterium]CAA0101562.1 Uncharacterised protein [BD1-7 clade bacterium]
MEATQVAMQETSPSNPIVFLNWEEVQKRIPMSYSAVQLQIKEGAFPKPVKRPGGRSVFWVESEITEYQEQLMANR